MMKTVFAKLSSRAAVRQIFWFAKQVIDWLHMRLHMLLLLLPLALPGWLCPGTAWL